MLVSDLNPQAFVYHFHVRKQTNTTKWNDYKQTDTVLCWIDFAAETWSLQNYTRL